MDVRTDGKSPHSTGLRPQPGPLSCFNKENSNPTNWKTKVKQGKGTADHLMPLGDWLVVSVHLSVRPSVLPSIGPFVMLSNKSVQTMMPLKWAFKTFSDILGHSGTFWDILEDYLTSLMHFDCFPAIFSHNRLIEKTSPFGQ